MGCGARWTSIQSTLCLATQEAMRWLSLIADVRFDYFFLWGRVRGRLARALLECWITAVMWKDIGFEKRNRMSQATDFLGRVYAGIAVDRKEGGW